MPRTTLHFAKIRFRDTGEVGEVVMSFNEMNDRFGLLDEAFSAALLSTTKSIADH